MPKVEDAWGGDWEAGLRLRVERAGRTVLGPGRLELLEAIDRWHSISEAARQTGMAYRTAWLLVQSINEAAGEPLVVAAVGGSRGGGAELTARAKRAVAVFRQLEEDLQQFAAGRLPSLIQAPATRVVHVAAAVSLEEVLERLLALQTLKQPRVRVRAVFGASDELADQLLAGAPGDLFLSADFEQVRRLQQAGLMGSGMPVVLARNRLAAIAAADKLRLVRKAADLAREECGRVALAEPTCPLGAYTRDYLQQLGIYEAVSARAVRVDNSRAVVAAVRGGQASVGLVYTSDAMRADGCQALFPVRLAGDPIEYVGVTLARARRLTEAQALLGFLQSDAARRVFRACGFLPVRRPSRSIKGPR